MQQKVDRLAGFFDVQKDKFESVHGISRETGPSVGFLNVYGPRGKGETVR